MTITQYKWCNKLDEGYFEVTNPETTKLKRGKESKPMTKYCSNAESTLFQAILDCRF